MAKSKDRSSVLAIRKYKLYLPVVSSRVWSWQSFRDEQSPGYEARYSPQKWLGDSFLKITVWESGEYLRWIPGFNSGNLVNCQGRQSKCLPAVSSSRLIAKRQVVNPAEASCWSHFLRDEAKSFLNRSKERETQPPSEAHWDRFVTLREEIWKRNSEESREPRELRRLFFYNPSLCTRNRRECIQLKEPIF